MAKGPVLLRKLMLPILKGGLNLPDIRSYNLARLLRHSTDWIKGTSYYSNLDLEAALVSPWPLTTLLHKKLRDIQHSLNCKLNLVSKSYTI